MINNGTFKKHKTGYFPKAFNGSTADKDLKQYQIELGTDSLLCINIGQNQIKSCVSLVSRGGRGEVEGNLP